MLDERHELADGMIRVLDPILLKVPAAETLPIPFVEMPPADKPAEKVAAKAIAPSAAPAAVNVTNGFAVLIRDKGDKSKYWLQRIEFKPWKPSDFLEVEFDYNESRQELHGRLKAKDNGPFPQDTAKTPIQVRFATNPGSGLGKGSIESPCNRSISAGELPAIFRTRVCGSSSTSTAIPTRCNISVPIGPISRAESCLTIPSR